MYEVIVVGGGHAGCEASLACARKGHKTLLVTGNIKNIADMPCNPSIGGSAKGIVVREIDALGGEMGRNADKTLFQLKLLNKSKGPAVRSLRSQADKVTYTKEMIKTLNNTDNLTIKEAIVKDLLTSVVKDSGGTATYCKISGIDVAAKTGTTNDDYDRWLCGFTNYYAAATWFGFDKQEVVKYSGNPAGQIFAGVMKSIHKDLPNSKFEKTANIVTARVCKTSGRLATDKCANTYTEVFIKGKLPKTCDAHDKQFTVCAESGLLPNEFCPSDKLVTKQSKYIVEKEKTDKWKTTNLTTEGENAPTAYCNIHKKVEVVKPIEEPNVSQEQEEPEIPSEENSNANQEGDTEQKAEAVTPEQQPEQQLETN